jgi:rhodanese-related sulfurtransferase
LNDPDPPVLLDVRTDDELRLARVEGALHMPMHLVALRMRELDPRREIAVMCHLGGRSAFVVEMLRRAGFARARNLDGGIDRWAAEVDPSIPRY